MLSEMSEREFKERMIPQLGESKMEEDILASVHKKVKNLSQQYLSLYTYTKNREDHWMKTHLELEQLKAEMGGSKAKLGLDSGLQGF